MGRGGGAGGEGRAGSYSCPPPLSPTFGLKASPQLGAAAAAPAAAEDKIPLRGGIVLALCGAGRIPCGRCPSVDDALPEHARAGVARGAPARGEPRARTGGRGRTPAIPTDPPDILPPRRPRERGSPLWRTPGRQCPRGVDRAAPRRRREGALIGEKAAADAHGYCSSMGIQ